MSTSSSRLAVTAAVVAAGLLIPSTALAKNGGSTPAPAPAPAATPAPAPAAPAAPAAAAPVASKLTADQLCASYVGKAGYQPMQMLGGCTIVRWNDANPFDVRLSIVSIAADKGWTSKVLYTGTGVVSKVGVRYFKTGTKTYTDFQLVPGKIVLDGRN